MIGKVSIQEIFICLHSTYDLFIRVRLRLIFFFRAPFDSNKNQILYRFIDLFTEKCKTLENVLKSKYEK